MEPGTGILRETVFRATFVSAWATIGLALRMIGPAIATAWAGRERVLIIGAAVSITGVVAAESITPILFGKFVESLAGSPLTGPLALALGYVAGRIISGLASTARDFTTMMFERSVFRQLSIHFVSVLLRLPRESFSLTSTELTWRCERSLHAAANCIANILFQQIPLLVQFVLAAAITAVALGPWSLIAAAMFLIFYATSSLIAFSHQITAARAINEASAMFYGELGGVITNIETVKYFGRERYFSSRLTDRACRIYQDERRLTRITVLSGFFQEMVIIAAWAVITLLVLHPSLRSHVSVGDFVMLHTFFFMLIGPLRSSVSRFCQFAEQCEDLRFLDRIGSISRTEAQGTLSMLRPTFDTLELSGIDFGYEGREKALVSVDLSISRGECVALMGPSGSGKSTLAKLIYRLYEPDAGTILLDGTPVDQFDLADYRAGIAIVPQQNMLFQDTVRNNITLGALVDDDALQIAITQSRLDEVLARLPEGLETIVHEHGRNLSGGEQQRLCIARALVRRPRLLILDEAGTALDQANEAAVWLALMQHRKDQMLILITHRAETAALADRVFSLQDGKLIRTDCNRAPEPARAQPDNVEVLS